MLLSSPGLAQSHSIDRLLDRAQELAERGRALRARSLLRRAAQRADANDERPALAMASLLPERGPPSDDARTFAEEVRQRLAPHQSAEAQRARAWATALTGRHAEALEAAIRAAGPQDAAGAALLVRLAAEAVERGDLGSAQRALENAHETMPQDTNTLSDLGTVQLARGATRTAVTTFERVVARRASDADARRDLAGALVADGRPDAAVTILMTLVRGEEIERETAGEVWLELASAALEAGHASASETAALRAIDILDSDDPRGHAALGSALVAMSAPERAARAFRAALARDPSHRRARQGLAALGSEPEARAGETTAREGR